MTDIARSNLAKLHKDSDRFVVIHGDACTFKDYDTSNYIYMYNPLDIDGMKCVVENLKQSLKRKPRNLYIIYQNPRFWELFTKDGLFDRVVVADMSMVLWHKA